MQELDIGKELNRGAFGIVRRANWAHPGGRVEVAVKSITTGAKASTKVLDNFGTEVPPSLVQHNIPIGI